MSITLTIQRLKQGLDTWVDTRKKTLSRFGVKKHAKEPTANLIQCSFLGPLIKKYFIMAKFFKHLNLQMPNIAIFYSRKEQKLTSSQIPKPESQDYKFLNL